MYQRLQRKKARKERAVQLIEGMVPAKVLNGVTPKIKWCIATVEEIKSESERLIQVLKDQLMEITANGILSIEPLLNKAVNTLANPGNIERLLHRRNGN